MINHRCLPQVSPSSTFHVQVFSLLSPLFFCVGWTFVSFLPMAHLELMVSILCYHSCPFPQWRCDIKHLLHAYCFRELKKMKSTIVNASWSLLAKHLYMSYYSPWMLRVNLHLKALWHQFLSIYIYIYIYIILF
jgi:hypothetical protein